VYCVAFELGILIAGSSSFLGFAVASSRLNASGKYPFKAVQKLVERELYKLTGLVVRAYARLALRIYKANVCIRRAAAESICGVVKKEGLNKYGFNINLNLRIQVKGNPGDRARHNAGTWFKMRSYNPANQMG